LQKNHTLPDVRLVFQSDFVPQNFHSYALTCGRMRTVEFVKVLRSNAAQDAMDRHLIIVGFMGTGKSTVACEIGAKLNCLPVDLDQLITRRAGHTPGEIIEQAGEEEFRRIEHELLREVLSEQPARIIAVGGGAWTIPKNRQLIAENGALAVWLDAPFEVCWQRIEAGGDLRPLAPSREIAEQLYLERQPIYKLANIRISISDHESAGEIATRIAEAISLRQQN
jgi:shikimate kinase